MKPYLLILIASLTAFFSMASRPAEAPKAEMPGLFESSDVLKVTLKGDVKSLIKDKLDERNYHPFVFSYLDVNGDTVSQNIKVKVRGNFRRDMCKFPPLRLKFGKKKSKGTIFEGLGKVKMVVPCQMNSDKYTQFIHEEYLSYKGYNIITDTSFRVRLMETTFIDESGKFGTFTEWSFVIEPVEELAFRLGGKETTARNVHPNSTNRLLATKLSFYQYLIGNTDWSIPALHNIKLIQMRLGEAPLAVPYDFDFSGLVSAPYAIPNPRLEISSVRERLYRGFCQSEKLTLQVVDHFNSRKDEMLDLFKSNTYLNPKGSSTDIKYLERFYKTTENPKFVKRIFIKGCRTS